MHSGCRYIMSVADNPNNEKAGNAGSGKALLKVIEVCWGYICPMGNGPSSLTTFANGVKHCPRSLVGGMRYNLLQVDGGGVSHLIAVEWLDSKCWLDMVCCGASSGDGLAFH
ncbi:Pharynx and intestine in excess protein 1 [Sarracenia purpurea var. burkii]